MELQTDGLHAFGEDFPALRKESEPDLVSELSVVMAQLDQTCQERADLQFNSRHHLSLTAVKS